VTEDGFYEYDVCGVCTSTYAQISINYTEPLHCCNCGIKFDGVNKDNNEPQ